MGVNKVILLGNLGADPELRYTPNQTAVCNFRIATTERRKGADGEWTDHTEWHSIVTFGKTAENCAQYLQKGRQAFIDGRIQTRKWQDKEGNNRYTTEIIANTVQFVGGRADSANIEKEFTSPKGSNAAVAAAASAGGIESVPFDDDDIPF